MVRCIGGRFIKLTDLARLMGYSPSMIRKLCNEGRLACYIYEKFVVVDVETAINYVESMSASPEVKEAIIEILRRCIER